MTLVYLAGAWLLGVLGSAATGGVWWPAVAAIAVAGVTAAVLERRPGLLLLGALAAGLFVGGGALYVDQRPPDEPAGIALLNDGAPVTFRALVDDEPDVRGRSQRVRLSVREVFDGEEWAPASGRVLLRQALFPRHRYGDVLELTATLETPPAFPDFDYREFLARQGIVSLASFPDEIETIATGEGNPALGALHSVRRQLGDAIGHALPEPQAALAQGIFLGQRAAIPQELTDDLNATGTSHLVAISGHNVSLVAALFMSSLAWLIGRRQAAVVALVAIAAYTGLTGASPTVVRAAIMGGLFVVATLAGRQSSAAPAITLAAAIMTAWDPLVVHDVSFQLSFAAILGLVYLTPAFEARGGDLLRRAGVEPAGLAGSVLESTAMTFGAVAATLPLIALNFGRISAVAPISNLLVVPAFPLILVSSGLTAVAGVIWAPLGEAAGWLAWVPLTYMIELARFFAELPLASFEVDGFGRGHAAALYLALAALAWWLARGRSPMVAAQKLTPAGTFVLRPAWLLAGGLALAASLAWWAALDGGGDRLRVSVLDIGQGDAILIETPAGQRVLIDGGPSGQAVTAALSEELPFWERTIDLVVLTHPQDDHLTGLIDVLDRYDVRAVLASPATAETAAYDEWLDAVEREGLTIIDAFPGQRIDLGDGAVLRVLAPGDFALASGELNDASVVLALSWHNVDFLLTGDIERAGERALLRSGAELRSTVLKVPHHGSATSSSAAFLDAVGPAVALISVGEANSFGHPAPAVLERYAGSLVLRTDEHGTVTLETDGERLWVRVER